MTVLPIACAGAVSLIALDARLGLLATEAAGAEDALGEAVSQS
jgi:hypothetical protein